MTETYEFTSEENKRFRSVVVLMRFMSAGLYVSGCLYMTLLTLNIDRFDDYLASGLGFTLSLILGTAVLMAVAALLYNTSSKFQKVIDTEGSDILHLMTGLRQLNNVFRWGSRGLWLLVFCTAIAIVVLLIKGSGA